jgi:hypothetical protein
MASSLARALQANTTADMASAVGLEPTQAQIVSSVWGSGLRALILLSPRAPKGPFDGSAGAHSAAASAIASV